MIVSEQTGLSISLSWVLGLSATFASAQPSDAPIVQPSHLDVAMLHYDRCQWPEAFEFFAGLADAGDGHAARIALLMQAHGTRLFGGRFTIAPAQRERWLDVAAARSPVGFEFVAAMVSQAQHPDAR